MNVSECVGDSGCDLGGSCTESSRCVEDTHCGQTTAKDVQAKASGFDLGELKASLLRKLAPSASAQN
jgi:hypothetical protein